VFSAIFAHHAFTAEFDSKRPVKFENATVTRVQLINPHSWIYVDVKKPDGAVENWAIEAEPQHSSPPRDHERYAEDRSKDHR